MGVYRYKDEQDLGWAENKENLTVRLRQISRRVQNEILRDMSLTYWDEANRGHIVRLVPTDIELMNLFVDQTNKVLGEEIAKKKSKKPTTER